jgi:hypothetical protein
MSERVNKLTIKNRTGDRRFFVLGKYRHWKGGVYEAVSVCVHCETGEEMVFYKNKDGEYVRPLKDFLGLVEGKDGYSPRFFLIDGTNEEEHSFYRSRLNPAENDFLETAYKDFRISKKSTLQEKYDLLLKKMDLGCVSGPTTIASLLFSLEGKLVSDYFREDSE